MFTAAPKKITHTRLRRPWISCSASSKTFLPGPSRRWMACDWLLLVFCPFVSTSASCYFFISEMHPLWVYVQVTVFYYTRAFFAPEPCSIDFLTWQCSALDGVWWSVFCSFPSGSVLTSFVVFVQRTRYLFMCQYLEVRVDVFISRSLCTFSELNGEYATHLPDIYHLQYVITPVYRPYSAPLVTSIGVSSPPHRLSSDAVGELNLFTV